MRRPPQASRFVLAWGGRLHKRTGTAVSRRCLIRSAIRSPSIQCRKRCRLRRPSTRWWIGRLSTRRAPERRFAQFLFAHNALGRFSSAFRGKRTPPSLYWGTFDLTTTLFSGEPLPFDPTASIVERAAFDEELMEFGFWPGDERTDEPSFFALPYPFIDGEPSERPAIRGGALRQGFRRVPSAPQGSVAQR